MKFDRSKFMQKRRHVLLAGVGATVLAVFYLPLLITGSVVTPFDNWILERHVRLRGAIPPDSSIVIVGIADSSFSRQRQAPAGGPDLTRPEDDSVLDLVTPDWPWNRRIFARLVRKLADAGASAIAIDLVFTRKMEGDSDFAAAIAEHADKVVLASFFRFDKAGTTMEVLGPNEGLLSLVPEQKARGDMVGFANLYKDSDDHVRRGFFAEQSPAGGHDLLSLVGLAAIKAGRASKLPARDRYDLIDFAGPAGTYEMIPVEALFTQGQWRGALQNGKYFRDKIVLVGPYAEAQFKDVHATPAGRMPGPEIHANQLACLLGSSFIREPPAAASILLAVLVTGLTLSIFLRMHNIAGRAAILFVLVVALAMTSYLLFRQCRIFIPLSGMFLGVVVCGNAVIIFDFILERHQRSRISAMFGTYVSPALVDSIIRSGEEPTLGGEEVDITCFFSDVQSFSAIAEQLTPGRLVELMNEYLTAMTGVLDDYGGTLDKYVGDGIVAMFGAPIPVGNHAHQACLAALAMQRAQLELRKSWQGSGTEWPAQCQQMRMRIGMNSGVATVGNMGSEKRFNYTAMGDNVNLAARCESAAKYYGVYILASDETRTRCLAQSDDIAFRFVDNVVVQGRVSPVAVHEVMGLKAEMSSTHRQLLDAWPDAITRYLNRDWKGAIAVLESCREWEPLRPGRDAGVKTTPSDVLLARCRGFAANDPGPNWNGVFVLPGK